VPPFASAEQWIFYPLALLTVASALGVVLARSPLYGALSMACSFFFLAAVYLLLGAGFVGVLQIVVYAGAVMVLFLLVIMLLSLEPGALGRPRVTLFKVAGGASAAGLVALAAWGAGRGGAAPRTTAPLPEDFGTVAAVGRSLFNDHLLQFEALSLLLLAALAAAVVLAKKKL
jgi:NADH-quinone oxidoreductase subunit J